MMAALYACGRSWGRRWSNPLVRGRIVPWSFAVVAPSAPGNRPNRLSKLRFSLIRNTTCLIGVVVWNPFATTLGGWVARGSVFPMFEGSGAGPPDVHADATSAAARTADHRTEARRDLLMGRGGGPMVPADPLFHMARAEPCRSRCMYSLSWGGPSRMIDPPMRPIARLLALSVLAAVLALPGRAVADPIEVHVTSPAADAALRGTLQVRATAPHADSVTFQWSPNGTWKWADIGTDSTAGDGWKAPWDTTAVTDGTRYVRARALSGEDTSTSETVSVTVDNTAPAFDMDVSPPAFSPNGDGIKDRTFALVTLPEPARLEIDVVTAGGRTVRRIAKSVDVPAGTRRFEWNGVVFVDGHYRTALDGTFRVVATATDLAGNTAGADGSVRVDTKVPGFEWRGISPEPASGTGPVTFSFRTADRGAELTLSAAVWNDARRVTFVDGLTAPVGVSSVEVTPTTSGGSPLPPGLYRARLVLTDEAGNKRVTDFLSFRVIRSVTTTVVTHFTHVGNRVALTFDDCIFGDAWTSILNTLDAFGVKTTFFCNSVNLSRNEAQARRTVASLGFAHTMLWDVDPQDWSDPGVSVIVDRVLSHAHAGMVVVMHVKPQTAEALPSILRGLAARGLHQVSLPEMFRVAGGDGLVKGPATSGRITEG